MSKKNSSWKKFKNELSTFFSGFDPRCFNLEIEDIKTPEQIKNFVMNKLNSCQWIRFINGPFIHVVKFQRFKKEKDSTKIIYLYEQIKLNNNKKYFKFKFYDETENASNSDVALIFDRENKEYLDIQNTLVFSDETAEPCDNFISTATKNYEKIRSKIADIAANSYMKPQSFFLNEKQEIEETKTEIKKEE